jgi:hypothetical protein
MNDSMELNKEKIIDQSLAMVNNYFFTDQTSKGLKLLNQIKEIDPYNDNYVNMMSKVMAVTTGTAGPDMEYLFGKDWVKQDLNNKSIQIFCDQGIGDTLNLLRYVKKIKDKYDCRVILNCYAYFKNFYRLIKTQSYIDEFTNFNIRCDYHTNIMSLPALLNDISFDTYYPVHFKEILQTNIPKQKFNIDLEKNNLNGRYKIGIVFQSNKDNEISVKKSIDSSLMEILKDEDFEFYCLQPNPQVPKFVNVLNIDDLMDTCNYINAMDCVVSVDTAVLHLSGLLDKKTFGLLAHEADPRWGNKETTEWYESVELLRRKKESDNWENLIDNLKLRLVSFLKKM